MLKNFYPYSVCWFMFISKEIVNSYSFSLTSLCAYVPRQKKHTCKQGELRTDERVCVYCKSCYTSTIQFLSDSRAKKQIPRTKMGEFYEVMSKIDANSNTQMLSACYDAPPEICDLLFYSTTYFVQHFLRYFDFGVFWYTIFPTDFSPQHKTRLCQI